MAKVGQRVDKAAWICSCGINPNSLKVCPTCGAARPK